MLCALEKHKLTDLEDSLGYRFKDLKKLQRALIHSSYQSVTSNESMEFLGDAVLQYVFTVYLWRTAPKMSEGDLTLLRSSLVNKNSLTLVANSINLDKYLRQKTPNITDNMLEDAFEAVVAGIYLDSDVEHTECVLLALYKKLGLLPLNLNNIDKIKNPISVLQELVAKDSNSSCTNSCLSYSHKLIKNSKIFQVVLKVYDMKYVLEDRSVKKGKVRLAKKALEYLAKKKDRVKNKLTS